MLPESGHGLDHIERLVSAVVIIEVGNTKLLQFANPYIPVTYPAVISVVLKLQWPLAMSRILGPTDILCSPFDLNVILDQNTVVDNCQCSRFYFLSEVIEFRHMINNIIGIPCLSREAIHDAYFGAAA